MSPVPHLKCSTPISPVQKIANKHQVFVRPLQAPKTPSPAKQYNFGSGHSGDLRDINKLVQVASANRYVYELLNFGFDLEWICA